MSELPSKYHGHMTMADGSHVALSADEAEMMWRESEAATARLAAEMPDDAAALAVMSRAHSRLRELGWRDIIYCPKDGTWFDAIEAGSSGIHLCQYTGEWPNGSWWIASDGDLWPSHPILFRLDPEAEAARKAKMAEAAERYRNELSSPEIKCPVCDVAFKPDDICAMDIEMWTCHAECLEGSPVVDLDTGEETGGKIATFRFSDPHNLGEGSE